MTEPTNAQRHNLCQERVWDNGDMTYCGLPSTSGKFDKQGRPACDKHGVAQNAEDQCLNLHCFHCREYHVLKCAFSGCTCPAFQNAPTEEEAIAILRQEGIEPSDVTNSFIEFLLKKLAVATALAEAAVPVSEAAAEESVGDCEFCDHPSAFFPSTLEGDKWIHRGRDNEAEICTSANPGRDNG